MKDHLLPNPLKKAQSGHLRASVAYSSQQIVDSRAQFLTSHTLILTTRSLGIVFRVSWKNRLQIMRNKMAIDFLVQLSTILTLADTRMALE